MSTLCCYFVAHLVQWKKHENRVPNFRERRHGEYLWRVRAKWRDYLSDEQWHRLPVSPEREGSPPPDPERAGTPCQLADDWQPSWGEGSVEPAAPDTERGSPSDALTAAAPDDDYPDDPGSKIESADCFYLNIAQSLKNPNQRRLPGGLMFTLPHNEDSEEEFEDPLAQSLPLPPLPSKEC